MTNPRDVKYASESIANWQAKLKDRAMLETNNITFACLRAFLHELRGRMEIEAIARFGNHLPAVQRGVFYQDWVPGGVTPTPDLAAFEAALAKRLLPHVHMPSGITRDILWLLKTESEAFDAEGLRAVLPGPLRDLWDEVAE